MPVSPPSTSRRHAAAGRRSVRPARRRLDALWAIAIGVPLGLVACGGLVWQASYAAFTVETSTPSSVWTSGSVVLSDDDAGRVMFSPPPLAPSSPAESRCIRVTSSGTLTSDIRMFAAVTGDSTLAQNLDVTVDVGTVGTFDSCGSFTGTRIFTGTLAAFGTSNSSWTTGVGSWTATPTGSRTYRVTYKLNANAPNTVQNRTTAATFTWEARST